MTKHEGREERSRHDVGWIVHLEHRCVPQLEINGLPAVSVGWREALCGWTAMLNELEDQVAAFFEFDVTIGSCVADALCAAWWLIQQGLAGEDTASDVGSGAITADDLHAGVFDQSRDQCLCGTVG